MQDITTHKILNPIIRIVSSNRILTLGLMTCLEKDLHLDCSFLIGEKLDPTIKADIVILDLHAGFLENIRLIKLYKNKQPDSKVIVFLKYDELIYAKACISSGAHAFIEDKAEISSLIRAIEDVLDGKAYLTESAKSFIIENMFKEEELQALTKRETEVVICLGSGKTCKECALELLCSHKTINVHRANIKAKLNIKSNMSFIKYCYDQYK
jgi:DNA-binding NarL/FixJ family response regulator